MVQSNFIDLDEVQVDKPVYRVMPFDRLLQALVSKELVLSKPMLWDDPFENALLRGTFPTRDGSRYSFAAKDYVYGQCWTLHRETDAMWRIYSHNKNGIRVTSTPRKLLDVLKVRGQQRWGKRCFIGRVKYQVKSELLKSIKKLSPLLSGGPAIAGSLLYKRTEFRHEREVRLIYCTEDVEHVGSVLPFAIDPTSLFDKIVFDPRADESVVKAQTKVLRALGYAGRVTQSTLYRIPQTPVVRR